MTRTLFTVLLAIALAAVVAFGVNEFLSSAENRISNKVASELQVIEDRLFHTQEARIAEALNEISLPRDIYANEMNSEIVDRVSSLKKSYEEVERQFANISGRIGAVESRLESALKTMNEEIRGVRSTQAAHEALLHDLRDRVIDELAQSGRSEVSDNGGKEAAEGRFNKLAVEKLLTEAGFFLHEFDAEELISKYEGRYNDLQEGEWKTEIWRSDGRTYVSRTFYVTPNIGVTYGVNLDREGEADNTLTPRSISVIYSLGGSSGTAVGVSSGHSYGLSESETTTHIPWPDGWSIACSQETISKTEGDWARSALGLDIHCRTDGSDAKSSFRDKILWRSTTTLKDANFVEARPIGIQGTEAGGVREFIPY